jgi:hypothetical protein
VADEWDLLAGLDRPLPLPADLRDRLEDRLIGPPAQRPLGPQLAADLAGALSASGPNVDGWLAGVAEARPLPPALAERLAAALGDRETPAGRSGQYGLAIGAPEIPAAGSPHRRPAGRRRWVAGVAAAAASLLAAGAVVAGLHGARPHPQVAASTGRGATGAASASRPAPTAAAPGAALGAPSARLASPPALGTGVGNLAVPVSSSGLQAASAPASPQVLGVTPPSGPTGGGVTVDIRGSGLAGATRVLFGGVASPRFVVVSGGLIRATAPPEPPGSVHVEVVGPGGASPPAAAAQFTYLP